MANKIANIDYLCVIREKNGKSIFETIDIPVSIELVSILEGMVVNKNATVLDMQSQMNIAFKENERKSINYVSPHAYGSSFIDITFYPDSYTFERYNQMLSEKKELLTSEYANQNKKLMEARPIDYNQGLQKYLDSKLEEYQQNLKNNYLRQAKRYICAHNYTLTLVRAKSTGDIRMYSTDTLGWSDFDYKVTNDITIHLGTNFGYGSSSYFRLNLKYKGVDILPYSYMVKYFEANRRDLLRYTRLYEVAHDSWNIAFSFVEETANLAASSAQDFLEKWVLNEIKEMVYGLHGILENPDFHINDMLNKSGKRADCGYLSVRNMYSWEKSRYGVYPEEMTMAIQAEKITGALDFLGNLSALSKMIPNIDGFISEIKEMAIAIVPKLEGMMAQIEEKVAILQEQKASKEVRLEAIKKALEPHEKEIDRIYAARPAEQKNWTRMAYASEYASKHKEYAINKGIADELGSTISRLSEDIRMRESFSRNLKECRGRVVSAGLLKDTTLAA